jgi:hypothetical protein
MLAQDLIQPVVKHIAGSLDYGARCDPEIALSRPPFSRSHRHDRKDARNISKVTCSERKSYYYHGLLGRENGFHATNPYYQENRA